MEPADAAAPEHASTQESIHLSGNRLLRDPSCLLQIGDGLFLLRVQEQLAEETQLAVRAEDGEQPRSRLTHIMSVSTHCVSWFQAKAPATERDRSAPFSAEQRPASDLNREPCRALQTAAGCRCTGSSRGLSLSVVDPDVPTRRQKIGQNSTGSECVEKLRPLNLTAEPRQKMVILSTNRPKNDQ